MSVRLKLSRKQDKVYRLSVRDPKRWNISVGAYRSGKTAMDVMMRIPYRIMHAEKSGTIAIVGCTAGSVERNILEPMRKIYSEALVGRIKSGGRVSLFGRECFVIGASRAGAGSKLQGCSLAYCYGDEITTWNEDVFRMIMSRLDRDTSYFDGTCNPESPFHWFKTFLDKTEKDGSIRISTFTMEDNPFISKRFIEAVKREYEGTVYYDRFILGKWRCAEGGVYSGFAACPEKFIIDGVDERIIMADIGVDFGGNGSATAFNLTGYTAGYEKVITLDEYYRKEIISPDELERDFIRFAKRAKEKYPALRDVYCDSAEQVLIRGLQNAVRRERLPLELHNARKGPIDQRIRLYCSMMGRGQYFIMRHCVNTIRAFSEAVWEKGSGKRLDNGSVNIDSLDAQEYSTERRSCDIQNSVIWQQRQETTKDMKR